MAMAINRTSLEVEELLLILSKSMNKSLFIGNISLAPNDSSLDSPRMTRDGGDDTSFYIYENTYAQAGLVTLYTLVFILCFVGNLAVVLVITLHWRMRSVTKFCLGNLAFANFCVAVFCMYQNLSMYLIDSWIFGDFLCKMYHFTNSLSYTASILILVVISVERYLVVLHPIRSRRILTVSKLRWIILGVWVVSALVSAPRIFFIVTIQNPVMVGSEYEVICTILSSMFDNHTADLTLFILLFLLPLLIISGLYTQIGLFLHKRETLGDGFLNSTLHLRDNQLENYLSSVGVQEGTEEALEERQKRRKRRSQKVGGVNGPNHPSEPCQEEKEDSENNSSSPISGPLNLTTEMKSTERNRSNFRARSSVDYIRSHRKSSGQLRGCLLTRHPLPTMSSADSASGPPTAVGTSGGGSRVHRLLISIVITFALCNLPFHLRKLYQNFVPDSDFESDLSEFLTQLTFLFRYLNCALNPILFAFMSRSFRDSLVDVLRCRFRRRSSRDPNRSRAEFS